MEILIESRDSLRNLLYNDSVKNYYVISFYDPDDTSLKDEFPEIDKMVKGIIFVPVYDVDIDELREYQMSFDDYFPQADVVAKFIYKAFYDSESSSSGLICQCEYGQSRSAGCKAAIMEHFTGDGIKVFADYDLYPNKMVYHKLYASLERNAGL